MRKTPRCFAHLILSLCPPEGSLRAWYSHGGWLIMRAMEMTVPPAAPTTPHRARWTAGLSRNVWVLGLVSLLTDVSSEMIAPVRVLFLVGVLGTPLPIVGLIEGLAESVGSL